MLIKPSNSLAFWGCRPPASFFDCSCNCHKKRKLRLYAAHRALLSAEEVAGCGLAVISQLFVFFTFCGKFTGMGTFWGLGLGFFGGTFAVNLQKWALWRLFCRDGHCFAAASCQIFWSACPALVLLSHLYIKMKNFLVAFPFDGESGLAWLADYMNKTAPPQNRKRPKKPQTL